MNEQTLLDEALRPYNGSSGWSGSSTSRDRAEAADGSGETRNRQLLVLLSLIKRGPEGMTWRELADLTGWHHGTASGALSVLHKEGRIARLSIKRQRCKVYVLPEDVHGRVTEPHGRKPHACPNCGYVEEKP